jgi:acetyl coenzyme A synthetase (ADP forming)-like protein
MSASTSPTVHHPIASDVHVALRDGSTLHIRPVTPADRPKMHTFLDELSPESIGFRFFGAVNLEWVTDWSVDVNGGERFALVATTGQEQKVVAHAAYIRTAEDRAEVAFMVADAWQGHGIATIMLAHLAAVADEGGIALFTAEVLPHNHRMIDVFTDSGFPVTQRATSEIIEIELPTSLSPQAIERFEQREQTAAVAALQSFLRPRSVAVIGASRRRGTVGWALLHNLLSKGFTGAVYAVNEKAGTIQRQRAYASIAVVPEPVDLAVIAVPAAHVPQVARECGAAGVRGLLVISAGFAESGAEGAERQRELVASCRESGMRLIGPNCLGVFNTAPAVSLDATFAERTPSPGRVGFLSQSGGLGIAILEAAARLDVGLSTFVSVGNKADISGNDLLDYWEHDPDTDVLLMYLESFGNPRRFARIARRVSRSKPIVAVKSGRSTAGARASSSHTGALVSASDVTVDALFAQAGVIRTDTMHELFDVAALLSSQPAPRGSRVAIVTNAGGPGIMCADACEANGLEVVEVSKRTRKRLAEFLTADASLGNPIDMVATASAEDYRRTIETLVQEDACDAIVAIFVPPLVTSPDDVAREIRSAAASTGAVTLAAVFMTAGGPPQLREGELCVPAFDFPEDAAGAIAHAAGYSRWRARGEGAIPRLSSVDSTRASAVVAREVLAGNGWLGPLQVAELLECYGLPLIPARVVGSAKEAAAAAAELGGGPVALKAIAAKLLHKSDAGGVRTGLDGPRAIAAGARAIAKSVNQAGYKLDGLLVQPMAEPGVELLMGVVHDESFGPVIACGAGGTSAELLKDVAVRITPLTDLDAAEMVRSLRMFPLLDGYRGTPRCDIAAVEDVLLRLGALVEAHPEIAELDANPVLAGPNGAVIVDARIRLSASPPTRPTPSLRA